jgi:hypothetical protein
MASLVVSGDTSGSVTLSAPAVAGTTTLTLPTANGTIITTGSSGQSIPKAALPTGSVLQVVQATYSTSTSTTSSTFTDLGLSASITPTSSSSKILAIACLSSVYKNGANASVGVNIVRGSTEIVKFSENTLSYTNTSGASGVSATMNYLDSPSTTSSTTYKIQFKNGSATGTNVTINDSNVTSTLTLMEIAA